MTKEEKLKKIESLKAKAGELKKEVEYYNALQSALKLVLNGTYGALATPYFVLFNNNVAGTITAQGRDLIQTMDKVNEKYWYEQWHNDFELHNRMGIKNVRKITGKNENVSIYCDTDSLFVSFKPAIDNCDWKNLIYDKINSISEDFILLYNEKPKFDNNNCKGSFNEVKKLLEYMESLDKNDNILIIDGYYVKDRDLNKYLSANPNIEVRWNWSAELDFIQGVDKFRIAGYFKKCLEEYAEGYGVTNKEDFELEKISESIINIAKKKYIQHIVHEDGIDHKRMTYIFPKGVELIRSSTPLFAREKIIDIVKYLFEHPDSFNIKDLLKLVKNLRKEFELADIDEISLQSSCSNYENKIISDTTLPLKFVVGSHFAVKAAAHHNYLLNKNENLLNRYEKIKSGTKIKYYYCKDNKINDIFAYIRGSYPIEIAPQIDYDLQFEKAILSPINSIIEPLGMPVISKRLRIVMDIFGGF